MLTRDDLARALRSATTPEPWAIDRITYVDGVLHLWGWAIPPGGRPEDVTFTVNDVPFAQTWYPMERGDVGEVFWFLPGSGRAAFEAESRIAPRELFGERGYATLKLVHRASGAAVNEHHACFFPDEKSDLPMPDAARRKRVSGAEDETNFRVEGFTTFVKLDHALRTHTGRGLADARSILDFGCGCGRVTRHLVRMPSSRVAGADIDVDNLAWCRDNLPVAATHLFPLRPPTTLDSAQFDLAIGISVFSHLAEADELAWLEELRRLVSPGGFLLLTVLGAASVARSRMDLEKFERWRERGFLFETGNAELAHVLDDQTYYGTAWMTPEYVERTWSRFFEVVAIVPALIGNQQDLVVLRRRQE